MRLSVMVAGIMIFLCLGIQTPMAQASDLGALDIAAIKSIQINSDSSDYFMDVVVILENSGDKDLKLRNINFDVKFKEKNQTNVLKPITKAPLTELIIPGKTGNSEVSQVEAKLHVRLGPKNEETVQTLLQLFNIVGNPSNTIVMILEGVGEVGSKVQHDTKKGWIYQTGLKAELEFMPKIQKEILFK